MENQTPEILKTKQHFEILDGLRGVAAISVVVFHFMEVIISDYSKNFIGNGFLAVDFFFCLSGFVIGYAYDTRIAKMGVLPFFKSRLIRLQPLVIFGSVLGLLGFLFDPFGSHAAAYSAGKILLFFLTSVLVIPYPVMPERYFNLFSFNAPAWSLFWEYVANIFYAFILYKIGRRVLLALTIIAGLALCMVCYQAKSLMGGWGGPNFWDGSVRIAYSFLAGLLVYRSNLLIKNKLGFGGLVLLLVLAFIMPFSLRWNWLTETAVVLFYFPLLIALGAGAILTPGLKKICNFSGKISYPLYMTHYAGIWIFAGYLTTYKPNVNQLFFIVPASVIILIGIAYLVMEIYDTPVRVYLNNKRKQERSI